MSTFSGSGRVDLFQKLPDQSDRFFRLVEVDPVPGSFDGDHVFLGDSLENVPVPAERELVRLRRRKIGQI